jgi:hypothetical protein
MPTYMSPSTVIFDQTRSRQDHGIHRRVIAGLPRRLLALRTFDDVPLVLDHAIGVLGAVGGEIEPGDRRPELGAIRGGFEHVHAGRTLRP